MKGFNTIAIHSGAGKRDPHGTLRMPVYDTVAFEFENARAIQLAFEMKAPAHSYSRISNPTVEFFEERIRSLTGARGVIAVSSGMAAISNIILALAETGTNIITTRYVFGNTYSLFEHTLKPWGLEVRYLDLREYEALEGTIDEKTRAIFLETITNPQLQVIDVDKIAQIAAKFQVPVILDGTVTTPYLFRAKDHGVAVEVISSTKFISGGATAVGGLIIDTGNQNWQFCPRLKEAARKYGPYALIMHLRREVYRNLGACLSPHNAYLQTLGLETLGLRIEKSCQNALTVAMFLKSRPEVGEVNYPGLEDSPYHEVAKRQFGGRFGGILTFTLKDQAACFQFIDRLTLIKRSTNINDNKTLIIHPASTIFCEYTEEEKKALGVPANMLRVSVGIEDVEDLIEDLKRGFGTP